MIELKFSSEDPAQIRLDVAKLFAFDAIPVGYDAAPREIGNETAVGEKAMRDTAETVAVEQVQPGNKTGRRGKARAVDAKTIEGEVTSKTESPNISAQPENRTDPATAAQDKADEAASEQKEGAKVYSLEDVRGAAKAYIDKFGFNEASVDLVPCLMKVTGVGTMTELSKLNDQAKFKAAADAIATAAAAGERYEGGLPLPKEA